MKIEESVERRKRVKNERATEMEKGDRERKTEGEKETQRKRKGNKKLVVRRVGQRRER